MNKSEQLATLKNEKNFLIEALKIALNYVPAYVAGSRNADLDKIEDLVDNAEALSVLRDMYLTETPKVAKEYDIENEALEFTKWLAKNQWHPFSDAHWERWDDETESIEWLLTTFRFEHKELQKQKEDNV